VLKLQDKAKNPRFYSIKEEKRNPGFKIWGGGGGVGFELRWVLGFDDEGGELK